MNRDGPGQGHPLQQTGLCHWRNTAGHRHPPGSQGGAQAILQVLLCCLSMVPEPWPHGLRRGCPLVPEGPRRVGALWACSADSRELSLVSHVTCPLTSTCSFRSGKQEGLNYLSPEVLLAVSSCASVTENSSELRASLESLILA